MPSSPHIRARSRAEFVELVDQALVEVADLRDVLSFDEAQMSGAGSFIDEMDQGLRELRDALANGGYRHRDADLPFMEAIRDVDALIPFRHLLLRINATHRKGVAG